MIKIILDLCGGTGAFSKPYADNDNYDVRNITLPEYDLTNEKVVRHCIQLRPYGILFAVPCEIWGIAGNCRWNERTQENIFHHSKILIKGLRIIYSTNPKFWCIENPPGKMKDLLGQPTFSFQPYEYGADYTKKTYLWGRFNLPIFSFEQKPTVKDRTVRLQGKNRKELRAITPSGFAQAFYEANR